MVTEQFLADADGEGAGAVERANDERMEIEVDLGKGIAADVLSHMAMPAMALALPLAAMIARRSSESGRGTTDWAPGAAR